ncbi:MAG: DNA methyltransferase [Planctomycetota bacterium]|jgi:hypothetical protein
MKIKTTHDNEFPSQYVNRIICQDSLSFMRGLLDKCVDAIITDPPWPGCQVNFGMSQQQVIDLLAAACVEFERLTYRLVIVLGCDTDPRCIPVPANMPFIRLVYLKRIPPSKRGPILIDGDAAYVYGKPFLNDKSKVMPGTWNAVLQTDYQPGNPSPCKRHIDHMKFLINHYTRRDSVVFDPFCGSGQTLVAAKMYGRRYCGIDLDKICCKYADGQLADTSEVLELSLTPKRTDRRTTRKDANDSLFSGKPGSGGKQPVSKI